MQLNRDKFAAFKTRFKEVVLPELEGSTFIRELKAAEVVAYSVLQKTDPMAAVHYAIRVATTDADGNSVFQEGDDAVVANLPYKVLEALTDAVLELTGLKTAVEKK